MEIALLFPLLGIGRNERNRLREGLNVKPMAAGAVASEITHDVYGDI
jgi:hypothetical protein